MSALPRTNNVFAERICSWIDADDYAAVRIDSMVRSAKLRRCVLCHLYSTENRIESVPVTSFWTYYGTITGFAHPLHENRYSSLITLIPKFVYDVLL